MAQRALTEEQIRRCVFAQPYKKRGPNQFVREQPYIDIDVPGDDLPERFREPIVDTGDDVSPLDLPQGSTVVVRVYDRNAIDPHASGGTFGRGDLLGDYADAQDRCDRALEAHGVHVLGYLSKY